MGVTAEQVANAVRNENQDLPVGAVRSLAQERAVQVVSRMQRPEDFGKIIVARKNGAGTTGAPIRPGPSGAVADGAQEVESLALYNGQRTLALQVQKTQDDNTIAVTDGLKKAIADITPSCRPACGWSRSATARAPSAWR